jgi:hypothetical protein
MTHTLKLYGLSYSRPHIEEFIAALKGLGIPYQLSTGLEIPQPVSEAFFPKMLVVYQFEFQTDEDLNAAKIIL